MSTETREGRSGSDMLAEAGFEPRPEGVAAWRERLAAARVELPAKLAAAREQLGLPSHAA